MKILIAQLLMYVISIAFANAQYRSLDVLHFCAVKYMERPEFVTQYEAFITANNLDNDSLNIHRYAQIVVLHELFTATDSANGSTLRGDAPYMWNNWDNPAANHRLIISRNDTLLVDIDSPTGKYENFGFEERTPDIFLGDFFSETKYSHPQYGEFSTFGWCSEREMAFSVLLEAYGIPAMVEAPGVHAWTYAIPEFNRNGKLESFYVRIDNTYNQMEWGYESDYSSTKLQQWYNKQITKHSSAAYALITSKRAYEIIDLLKHDRTNQTDSE